jgi:hypothetical protein
MLSSGGGTDLVVGTVRPLVSNPLVLATLFYETTADVIPKKIQMGTKSKFVLSESPNLF